MEKLLINEYGEFIVFDENANSIVKKPSSMRCESVYIAQNNGQAISNTEVVDYNKDDMILVLSAYHEASRQYKTKVVVCSDLAAKDDIIKWNAEMIKQYETV